MKVEKIEEKLTQLFTTHRIVFWYDAGGEFDETFASLNIGDINVIRLDKCGVFETKIKIEFDDPHGRYLIYAPFPEPEDKDDWLLDTRIYSHTFRADMASIILDDLGLKNKSLRVHIRGRKKFFASKERTEKLKKWISPEDTAEDIDLKMLCVITKAIQPSAFAILINILDGLNESGYFDPSSESKAWGDIQRLGIEDAFWKIMRDSFGYEDTSPGLSDLVIHLVVTDFANNLDGDLPPGLKHFLLKDPMLSLNATVFLSQWRSDMNHYKSYDLTSGYFAKELKITDHISTYDCSRLIYCSTFEVIERQIIGSLVNVLLDVNKGEFDLVKEIIFRRRDEYWAKLDTKPYQKIYGALGLAINLFELRWKHSEGFSYPSAQAMYDAYAKELYLFDQSYRGYHLESDAIEALGIDILKPVDEAIEACYSEWFMTQIAANWGDFMEQGLIDNLQSLPDTSQYNFFTTCVEPYLEKQEKNRIFVIVSDGFRYEVGEELARRINGQYRFKAELDKMKSVLPSYTALGMAALLPHRTLGFSEKGEILVDGKPVDTLEKRSAALIRYGGIAIKADDLMAMSMDQGRAFIKDKRFVYIYHNEIDAVGDKASTEAKTFSAAGRTIDDLQGLCRFIINSLNGNRIVITADHGFVYCEKLPDHLDKSVLENKPSKAVVAKKRYILGRDLGSSTNVWSGTTRKTAQTEDAMEFWLPKGMNRFHFAGGARYFHGGAMLQEIMVPLITVTQVKGKDLKRSVVKKVGVALLSSRKKVVTNIARFEFIQTEAISERLKPQTLAVSLRDENTLVSDEQTVTFDSNSPSLDERKRSVRLMLKAGTYDPKKDYYLVLQDAVTSIEYERIPIKIDLAFSNVF